MKGGCSCWLVFNKKRVFMEGGNRRGHACWQLFNGRSAKSRWFVLVDCVIKR